MYKTILIPVDLGHTEAVAKMIDVARKLGDSNARIALCNVLWDIPEYVLVELPSEIGTKAEEEAEAGLTAIATENGLDPDIHIVHGQPAGAIMGLAEKLGAELIVVASHKPGLQDLFIGSTAARIVSHAKCCVHVIR
ncbi:MAG: universal stress protein [Rhodospirillales bacterium]